MKFSEKLGYLLQGKTEEEIQALEAAELEAEKAKEKDDSEVVRLTKSLETAASMVKELEDELQATKESLKSKEDELTKLNAEFANLNNKQTLKDKPPVQPDASDVFKELFNSKKKEV